MQYLREEGKVLFYREQQGRVEPVEMDAVECVARLVAHIPDHQERQVTYSGVYASASRHRRMRSPKDTEVEPGGIPEPESRYHRRMRMRWARLIRQVWLDDPLLCPRCGEQMAILPTGDAYDQGVHRYSRNLRWFNEAMDLAYLREWAFNWRLVIAHGPGHSPADMFDHPQIQNALFGHR
jgi:hypothetical protein